MMLAWMAGPALHFDLAANAAPREGRVAVAADQVYRDGGFGYEPGRQGKSFLFSAAVPEGNYRVTVRLGDRRSASRTTVKAESRRLMLRDVETRAGQFVTARFTVNVRTPALPAPPANAPGGTHVRLNARESGSYNWDEKLTLEFLGDPQVASIEIEPVRVPTLYLAGDSTVTDQPAEPAASWGQMLPAFFGPDIAIANHAESGETLKSFVTALRLDKLLSKAGAGDWLLIQFGHNDQKSQWPQTYADPRIGYPAWLRTYIAEARRRGVKPLLVTSPERRNFDGGRICPTLSEYADAMRQVAREEQVPLIDLHAASIALYEALGPDEAIRLFNDDGRDQTHHNGTGAYLLAQAVAAGLARSAPELAALMPAPPVMFDPARPPRLDMIKIAPSIAHSRTRPAGN